MKNPLFAFSACLRHAFMSGAGYGDYDRITDHHIDAWCNYDPPESGPFTTMAKLIADSSSPIIENAPEPPVRMAMLLGKDLEYMWKDIVNNIPKGSIWQHKENEAFYRVEGVTLNCLTDEWDVLYVPLYRCKIDSFTRQAVNHPKAFAARFALVNDGKAYASGRLYPEVFSQPPKEKEADE